MKKWFGMGGGASKEQLPTDLRVLNEGPRQGDAGDGKKKRGFLNQLRRSKDQNTEESSDSEIITKAPATVTFQGQALHFGFEPGGDGTLVVKQKGIEEEEGSAATRIQAAVRRHQARGLYRGLKALESMQLELNWPTGSPFIGVMVVRVREITDLSKELLAVKHPLLRARCDGDQSVNIRGHHSSSTKSVKFDYKATFVFVALRSAAVLTIDVLQSLELATRIVGKIQIPIASMAQGTEELDANIVSNAIIVGTMKLRMGYMWMRGTQDFGGYDGPQLLLLPSRKLRNTKSAVERLWKVNHWLCSHDNMWATDVKFADVVKLAVEHKRSASMDTAILTEDGRYVHAPMAVVPEMKKQQSGGKPRGSSMSTAELLARTVGTESWERVESFATQMHGHTPTISNADTLGNEDWHLAMEELYDNPNSVMMDGDFDGKLSKQIEEQLDAHGKKVSEYVESDPEGDSADESRSGGVQSSQPSQVGSSRDERPEITASIEKRNRHLAEKYEKKRRKKGLPTTPSITGKFEYGVYRPASKRDVHIFIRRAENSVDIGTPKPTYAGAHTTNKQGSLIVPAPKRFTYSPGHYHILGLLPDDNTFGRGSIFMLERGTKCVVFDLDGTITTSDVHVVTQVFLDSLSGSTIIGGSLGRNYDLKQRTNALSVCRLWAAKGYQIVYLSGRQGSAYNMTAWWLIRHGYPPGPIHLTRTHVPTLPVYVSVGHFKIKYMEELMSKGIEIYAAYGNTGTDIRAYEKIGIPKERTYIVGPNGGAKGTRRITDFTSHLPEILKFPDAEKPIPYTELLFSSADTK
ncbi:hypothetical protein BSKO_07120 [Bryopsis sp. KO-2023]|nr:hypothetical protein BSKO_07120 [Bryopsis sp. KO-2023]